MNRDTLEKILQRMVASGSLAQDGDADGGERFEIQEGHRVTFYIGRPGQAMQIEDIGALQLLETHLELASKDGASTSYLQFDALHAVKATASERSSRRAGFS